MASNIQKVVLAQFPQGSNEVPSDDVMHESKQLAKDIGEHIDYCVTKAQGHKKQVCFSAWLMRIALSLLIDSPKGY